MKTFIAVSMLMLLVGCAAQSGPGAVDEAIENFVVVSGLEELDGVRTPEQYSTEDLTARYAILKMRDERYLVKFHQSCPRLDEYDVVPDIRFDSRELRPRFDTIRGCRIGHIYAIDKAEAQELELIANEADDTRY